MAIVITWKLFPFTLMWERAHIKDLDMSVMHCYETVGLHHIIITY